MKNISLPFVREPIENWILWQDWLLIWNWEKDVCLWMQFLISQFNYCPVIWMCHSWALNNKINRLDERCLRIIYNNKTSTFEELQEKDNSVSINYKNIQALAIEMFKVANGVFQLREKSHYNLLYTSEFIIPPIHSVYHGSESFLI